MSMERRITALLLTVLVLGGCGRTRLDRTEVGGSERADSLDLATEEEMREDMPIDNIQAWQRTLAGAYMSALLPGDSLLVSWKESVLGDGPAICEGCSISVSLKGLALEGQDTLSLSEHRLATAMNSETLGPGLHHVLGLMNVGDTYHVKMVPLASPPVMRLWPHLHERDLLQLEVSLLNVQRARE